jgi:hypothetical protein
MPGVLTNTPISGLLANKGIGALAGLMPERPQTIADQAYSMYPKLKGYGFQFIDSRNDKSAGGRLLETYPADERDNPMPGKPTIRQFSPDVTPKDFLGEALHILPKLDPQVGGMRDQFIQSMTPQQQQKLMEQYEYHKQNFGEQRSFEQWKDVSGLDSWFRGYVSGQWPEEMYTPQQIQLFQGLEQYLKAQ